MTSSVGTIKYEATPNGEIRRQDTYYSDLDLTFGYDAIGNLLTDSATGAVTTNDYFMVDGEIVGEHTRVSGTAYNYYFVNDSLGSVSLVLNGSGTIQERDSYDAWGLRRNVNGTPATTPCSIVGGGTTTRGYTNQEMVDSACLINLNARFYDPLIARMPQADSVVGDAYNLQSLNRYSYVNNGPLSATDPTGNVAQFGFEFDVFGGEFCSGNCLGSSSAPSTCTTCNPTSHQAALGITAPTPNSSDTPTIGGGPQTPPNASDLGSSNNLSIPTVFVGTMFARTADNIDTAQNENALTPDTNQTNDQKNAMAGGDQGEPLTSSVAGTDASGRDVVVNTAPAHSPDTNGDVETVTVTAVRATQSPAEELGFGPVETVTVIGQRLAANNIGPPIVDPVT